MKTMCATPVFKKARRRMVSNLRQYIVRAGTSGSRSYLTRAGHYSLHQFWRSFAALFSVLLIVPRAIINSVVSIKNRESDGQSWSYGTGALVAIKDVFQGIPSLIRSTYAAFTVQLYGIGGMFYHWLETVKELFISLTGRFGNLKESLVHFVKGTWHIVLAPVRGCMILASDFGAYISGVWHSLTTGSSDMIERLSENEKQVSENIRENFIDQKDYISNMMSKMFDSTGKFFRSSWDFVTTRFSNTVGIAKSVTSRVGSSVSTVEQKVQIVAVDAKEKLTTAASGLKTSVASGQDKVVVHFKSASSTLRTKASDLMKGVKLGTVQIIYTVHGKAVKAQETSVLYLQASRDRGRELLTSSQFLLKAQLAKASIIGQAVRKTLAEQSYYIVGYATAAGQSAKVLVVKVYNPIANTVKQVVLVPSRSAQAVASAPTWIYFYMTSVFTVAAILFWHIRCRYQREGHARKVGISKKVRNSCQELNLSDAILRQCMDKFREQIELGLNPATKEKATVKCFNTYVQDLPTGKERGQFLALDLGGTNFRVLLITLNGRHFDMQSKIYVVSKELMMGPGSDLFDHIASCLESFSVQHRLVNKNLPLGFTFSFPLNQVGLKSGMLQRWTKGFDCAGTVGEDVVQLLVTAIKKRNMKIDVVAILNDTTGTLMSCAWKNHNCKVGVILGTGCDQGTGSNACYVEKISNLPGFDGDQSKPHVIINTEWGAFGDNGELNFIRTPYDKEIDKFSVNPGKQLFEKMLGGMYLGELTRLLIVKFVKDKILFGGQPCPRLMERYSFHTEFVSEIESDPRGVFKHCRNVLAKLNVPDPTDQDCSNVRYICESVSRRAAFLASAGVATLINKMDIPSVTVGVDGSLYRFHPHFHNLMHEKIPVLCNPSIENLNVNLMLSEDGSGRGAALIAAFGSEHLE